MMRLTNTFAVPGTVANQWFVPSGRGHGAHNEISTLTWPEPVANIYVKPSERGRGPNVEISTLAAPTGANV